MGTLGRFRAVMAAGAVLVGALTAGAARAGDPPPAPELTPEQKRADALFKEALALLQDNHYAEACPKLEQSEALDPAMGTRFRLAECYEALGRLATAWTLFARVAEDARREHRADREDEARQRADSLRPRVPGLIVVASEKADGINVTLDDKPLARADLGSRIPIDPGPHTIQAVAPGRPAWSDKVTAAEGKTVEVRIPGAAPAAPPPAPSGPGGLRIAGFVVGGLGLAALGAAFGVGAAAKGAWNDALGQCQDGAHDRCTPDGIQRAKDASGLATVATALAIAGGVVTAGGIVMIAIPPRRAAEPAAALSVELVPLPGGLALGGRF